MRSACEVGTGVSVTQTYNAVLPTPHFAGVNVVVLARLTTGRPQLLHTSCDDLYADFTFPQDVLYHIIACNKIVTYIFETQRVTRLLVTQRGSAKNLNNLDP